MSKFNFHNTFEDRERRRKNVTKAMDEDHDGEFEEELEDYYVYQTKQGTYIAIKDTYSGPVEMWEVDDIDDAWTSDSTYLDMYLDVAKKVNRSVKQVKVGTINLYELDDSPFAERFTSVGNVRSMLRNPTKALDNDGVAEHVGRVIGEAILPKGNGGDNKGPKVSYYEVLWYEGKNEDEAMNKDFKTAEFKKKEDLAKKLQELATRKDVFGLWVTTREHNGDLIEEIPLKAGDRSGMTIAGFPLYFNKSFFEDSYNLNLTGDIERDEQAIAEALAKEGREFNVDVKYINKYKEVDGYLYMYCDITGKEEDLINYGETLGLDDDGFLEGLVEGARTQGEAHGGIL